MSNWRWLLWVVPFLAVFLLLAPPGSRHVSADATDVNGPSTVTSGVAATFTANFNEDDQADVLAPLIVAQRMDVNGNGAADTSDDSVDLLNADDIVDGYVDCNDNGTPAEAVDDCTLVTQEGVSIAITDGLFPAALNGTNLRLTFSSPDADWWVIGGRVDTNGSGTIDDNDCSLNLAGTVDIVAFDAGGVSPCTGLGGGSDAMDGMVDVDGDGLANASDNCASCLFGSAVVNGLVVGLGGSEALTITTSQGTLAFATSPCALDQDSDGLYEDTCDVAPTDTNATAEVIAVTDANVNAFDGDGENDPFRIRFTLTVTCTSATALTITATQAGVSATHLVTCDTAAASTPTPTDGDDDDDAATALAPLPSLLTMSVSPTSIPCGSQATVSARLVYPSGEGVQHVIIGFSSTRGTVFGNILTNSTGNVTTSYIAPPSPTTATITASVDGHYQSVAVTVTCAVASPVSTQAVRPPSTGSGGLAGGSEGVEWPVYAGAFFVTSSLVAAFVLRKQRI